MRMLIIFLIIFASANALAKETKVIMDNRIIKYETVFGTVYREAKVKNFKLYHPKLKNGLSDFYGIEAFEFEVYIDNFTPEGSKGNDIYYTFKPISKLNDYLNQPIISAGAPIKEIEFDINLMDGSEKTLYKQKYSLKFPQLSNKIKIFLKSPVKSKIDLNQHGAKINIKYNDFKIDEQLFYKEYFQNKSYNNELQETIFYFTESEIKYLEEQIKFKYGYVEDGAQKIINERKDLYSNLKKDFNKYFYSNLSKYKLALADFLVGKQVEFFNKYKSEGLSGFYYVNDSVAIRYPYNYVFQKYYSTPSDPKNREKIYNELKEILVNKLYLFKQEIKFEDFNELSLMDISGLIGNYKFNETNLKVFDSFDKKNCIYVSSEMNSKVPNSELSSYTWGDSPSKVISTYPSGINEYYKYYSYNYYNEKENKNLIYYFRFQYNLGKNPNVINSYENNELILFLVEEKAPEIDSEEGEY